MGTPIERRSYSTEHILELKYISLDCSSLEFLNNISAVKKCSSACILGLTQPDLPLTAKIPQQSIDQNIASNQILTEECENPKDLVKNNPRSTNFSSNYIQIPSTAAKITDGSESYEKEKNISFEEFIKKLKKKNAQTNSISHESEDEKNAQDLHVQNSEKKMDMKDKHFSEPIISEPMLMIDPNCPIHSQSKNSSLNFMPSSVFKRLSIKNSFDSEQIVDPWERMKSQTNTQLFENTSNHNRMNTYSQGPIQNNIVPCQYHRATDFSHPIAQEPASEEHRIDNSIDPKVLMILKKLGKTGKSSDSRRCVQHSNNYEYFSGQANNMTCCKSIPFQFSNSAYNYN